MLQYEVHNGTAAALNYVPDESQLELNANVKVRVNMEGCVNTLRDECRDFYENFAKKDGRNDTSRAVYECFYDENNVKMVEMSYS